MRCCKKVRLSLSGPSWRIWSDRAPHARREEPRIQTEMMLDCRTSYLLFHTIWSAIIKAVSETLILFSCSFISPRSHMLWASIPGSLSPDADYQQPPVRESKLLNRKWNGIFCFPLFFLPMMNLFKFSPFWSQQGFLLIGTYLCAFQLSAVCQGWKLLWFI